MDLQYRYTNDSAYLQNTVYPYLRDVLRFYQSRFQLQNNEWVMPTSNAHETYWDIRNAVTDLAAIRLLVPIGIQVASQLGVDSGLRSQWQDLLNRLHPYQVSGGAWLPHDAPISSMRNNENVSAELIWPYDRTGIGASDYQTAVNTWNARPNPYGNVWSNDHAQAARLRLGDQAFNGMKLMLQRYQNYPNGMTNNTNGVFEYLGGRAAKPSTSACAACTASRRPSSTRGDRSRSGSGGPRTTRSWRPRARPRSASPPPPTPPTWWSAPPSRCRPTRPRR
jgi:alpha-L-fucosidase 2